MDPQSRHSKAIKACALHLHLMIVLAHMKQSNGLLQYPNSAYPTDCNANAVTDLDNLCSVFRFLLSNTLADQRGEEKLGRTVARRFEMSVSANGVPHVDRSGIGTTACDDPV